MRETNELSSNTILFQKLNTTLVSTPEDPAWKPCHGMSDCPPNSCKRTIEAQKGEKKVHSLWDKSLSMVER